MKERKQEPNEVGRNRNRNEYESLDFGTGREINQKRK
jgi:hypothetical protein